MKCRDTKRLKLLRCHNNKPFWHLLCTHVSGQCLDRSTKNMTAAKLSTLLQSTLHTARVAHVKHLFIISCFIHRFDIFRTERVARVSTKYCLVDANAINSVPTRPRVFSSFRIIYYVCAVFISKHLQIYKIGTFHAISQHTQWFRNQQWKYS